MLGCAVNLKKVVLGMKTTFKKLLCAAAAVGASMFATLGQATPYTMTVPDTGVPLPANYPEAGGVAIVLTGVNGNIYYQFSDPDGAFVGFQNTGQPARFRGNPFTINDPVTLDCGFRDCADYFGGAIAQMDVRFSAFDGDTQVGGFDFDDISLIMNGVNVGSWSNLDTQVTNNSGTSAIGPNNGIVNGFGNGTFNTAWFRSTDPALLGNILATGQTTTQVLDDDPSDNYWDFTRGNSLQSEELRTIAPGYELEKSRDIPDLTYATVDQVINYEYIVRNIGSVDIDNITVEDDKIVAPNTVTCDRTFLPKTSADGGQPAQEALCTASYVVTQADIDAGELTNVAIASGDPEFGSLGELSDQVTLTGPARDNNLVFEKTASAQTFSAKDEVITYTFVVRNEGNSSLSNIVVTDPRIPSLSCSTPSLLPLSSVNTTNTLTCTGTYTVTQADIDAADSGETLDNTAKVTARDPDNTLVEQTATASLTGPDSIPSMEVEKRATSATYAAVGDVINYEIEVTNTGLVTWPTAPAITDALTGGATCPAGPVAPMGSVICTASYTVDQDDLDAEIVTNEASAAITVNGQTATDSDTADVNATITPEISVEKALRAGSPDPFTATTDRLVYTYTVKNTGNVTVNSLVLVDDKVALTCPATTLAPDAQIICESAEYAVTQADLDAGSVTNNVTANATTAAGDPVPEATDDLTVDADQTPAMTMVKTAEDITALQFVPGKTVDYEYLVTNSGNTTLTDPITIIDDKFPDPIACPAGALGPTETVLCMATYTVTDDDVIAGFVTNNAFSKSGDTESDPDAQTIPQEGTPAITLEKSVAAGTTFSTPSDTIDYTFTITNSGDVTLAFVDDADTRDEIVINDPQISNVTCVQPAFLFPVSSGLAPSTMECTATFAGLEQADVDAGEFTNTATASFTYVNNGVETPVASPASSVTVPADVTPGFTFAKDAPTPATFTALNEVVTFTFTVTNTSTQTIAQAVVTDPAIPSLDCTLTNIGPAGSATQSASCTGDYRITQADMDAGTFTNTASASGTTPTGDAIAPQSDDATVTLPASARDESLVFDKIASADTFAAVGDEITYTFSVFNDGNVTLRDVVVVDAPLGVNCTIPVIGVGQTDTATCRTSKVITQADIDTGSFVNNASATSAGGATGSDTETATGPVRAPSFDFVKSTADTFDSINDPVVFTFAVTNTGNVTLTNVVVTDNFFDPALNCTIASILPGRTDDTTCTATYVTDQDDLDAGSITNTATVNANGPEGALPSKDSTAIVNAAPEQASFTVDKVETDGNGTFGAVNTQESYGFTITNTGLVTLKNVVIKDPLTGLDCPVADIAPGASAVSCDPSPLFASAYTIQQSDVDAGSLTNVVTVTASTTQGTNLSQTDQVILSGPVQAPVISMVKTATAGADFDALGDQVSYSYAVTNDGNITLTEPITIADDQVTVTCPALPAGGLAPMGVLVCTASDTVDQADLDAGEIINEATASVSQAVVPSALYPLGRADILSNTEIVTVTADQQPELTIVKRVKAQTPSTYDALDDVVTFEFVVTNTGNVTTTGQITVNDQSIPSTVACGPASGIAPDASVTCETTWTPEQSDIDIGEFTNTATASMPFGGATVPSVNAASATVRAVQQPSMSIVKTYRPDSLAAFATGEQATYDYLITNTGNQTIVGPVTVDDNLIASVDCSAFTGDLAPDAVMTCVGVYTVTVDDVRLGSATNVATAQSVTVNSDPITETIPEDGIPAMEITKAADKTTFSVDDRTITYTYTVTNASTGTPPPAFALPIFINDDKFADPIACWESTTDDPDVRPGETVSCEAVYTVTQADFDAIRPDPDGAAGALLSSFVKNTATGQTQFGTTDVVSAPKSVLINGEVDPSLLVEKAASSVDNPALAGSTVSYTITVTNDGNQTISGILVEDPMLDALTCEFNGAAAPANLVLAPTEAAICTGDYTVTQADIDAQVLENTATATGSDPTGAPLTQTGTTTYPLDPFDAKVDIEKTLATGTPATAFTDPGQSITFNIAVTNTGNITLTSTVVTDILFPGQECNIGVLAPKATDTTTCEFIYTVTQDDVDNGEITNTATATSQPATPDADPVTDSDTITGTGPEREPRISVGKKADKTEFDGDNQAIVYTYTVLNTGNITITSLPVVSDDKIVSPNAVVCDDLPAGGLRPSAELTCEATYQTTQADVDAGFVTNIANVSAPNPLGGAPLTGVADLTIPSVRSPAFAVTKTASSDSDLSVGQTVTYTYEVRNTGNVTLTDVTLRDDHTTQAGTAQLTIADNVIASLAPDAVATRTATYVITQADVDAGQPITNTLTATATPPAGVDPIDPQTADEIVTVQTPEPALIVLKTASDLGADVMAGDAVTFTITVRNSGNVTLSSIGLSDTLRRADGTQITPSPIPVFQSGDNGIAGKLDVDEVWTYEFVYQLTQADIDTGGINNSARATGVDPFGTQAADVSDNGANGSTGSSPTPVTIAPNPSVEATKRITDPQTTLGATVRFEIDVTNTGNVTLNSVAVSDDGLTRADGTALVVTNGPDFFNATLGSSAGNLRVGETATYRVSYVLTQDDIDAGGISNTATATGTPPVGSPVTDAVDTPVTLVIDAAPDIALVKSLQSGGPAFDSVGDVLTYAFEITNTGNITLTDAFTITDPLITDANGTITCAAPPLAPLASLTCEGSYSVQQKDIDAGKVDNVATASNGIATSDESTTTTPALQQPALAVDKQGVSITVDGVTNAELASEFFTVGAVVAYEYTVTNTGNETLTDAITVSDNRIADVSCPALPQGGLPPTQSIVCEATYTVTSDDVRLGSVTNAATATSGDTTSPIVTETVPADGVPSLEIVKALKNVTKLDGSISEDNTFDALGDVLTYTFTVTNTGDVAFTEDVTVEDARLSGPLVCFTATQDDPDFRKGDVVTCEGSYTIVQEDLDNAEVFNEALAQTIYGEDNAPVPVISDTDTETTPASVAPALTIAKSAATLPVTVVDQVITYTLTLTNSGNQTLTSVVATDPLIPALECEFDTLNAGQVETCTGTYTVTQADVDRGTLTNTAAVTAVSPNGTGVGDETSLTIDMPAAAPQLTMTKVGSPDPFGAVGTTVTYVFTLANTGNVTLFDLNITDAEADPDYSCDVARLNVGATDATCALSYTVTQADKDAGEIINVATVTGRDPFNPIDPVDARSVITAQDAKPSLEVTKTASLGGSIAGSRVEFTLQVENTGDVFLNVGDITDTMTRKDGTPIQLTESFAFVTGDTDTNGRLDVDETWTYAGAYILQLEDVNAGGIVNSANVAATDPFQTAVDDTSDNGNDADGNAVDDPTVVDIVQGPAINTVKTLTSAGDVAGAPVVFTIVATNIGNVSLSDVTPSDDMSRADGAAIDNALITIAPADVTTQDTALAPNETRSWTVTYTLRQEDVDAGGLFNSATVTGTDPTGATVSDLSDNGNDADGNLVDDPTPLTITAAPQFNVVKTFTPLPTDRVVQEGEVVTFAIAVTNNGNVTLDNLVLTDTLTRADGVALEPDDITLTQGASETQVLVDETLIFTVTYALQQADIDAGGIQNTATVDVTTPSGVPLSDVSDDGDNTDGNTLDDPTIVPVVQVSALAATKTASIPARIAPDLSQVVFTMTVTNTGNVSQTNMVIEDNLVPFVSPATLSGPQTPVVSGFNGTGGANASYNGVSDIAMTAGDISLVPGQTGTIVLTVTYDTSGGNFPTGTNTVVAKSDLLAAGVSARVGVIESAEPDIVAIKTATPERVTLGDTVTYTLVFENRLDTIEDNLTIIDDMPAGVIYTPGTARYDGAATPAPISAGRQLRWEDVTLAPRQTVTITFDARVVGEQGQMTNRAYMQDSGGNVVSNIAQATITRRAEAVFDCSDIIGKVFDDRNMNGYQDGATQPNTNAVSDQSLDGGKGKAAPVPDTPHEPGLPHVRLVTVDGTVITTDQYGRFSVPCAALPADIGSNFTLKLDTRSLPTGYRVTTENPRVIRVTQGTVAKINFGAAIANVVDIDLMANAFQNANNTPTAALAAGVDQLVQSLSGVPSVLRLTYYMNDEGRMVARARLDAVERMLRDKWRTTGRYRLLIERAIKQIQ